VKSQGLIPGGQAGHITNQSQNLKFSHHRQLNYTTRDCSENTKKKKTLDG